MKKSSFNTTIRRRVSERLIALRAAIDQTKSKTQKQGVSCDTTDGREKFAVKDVDDNDNRPEGISAPDPTLLKDASRIAVKAASVGVLSALGAAASKLGSSKTGQKLADAAQRAKAQTSAAAQNLPIVGHAAGRIAGKLGDGAVGVGKLVGKASGAVAKTTLETLAPTKQAPDNSLPLDRETRRRILKNIPFTPFERFLMNLYFFFYDLATGVKRMVLGARKKTRSVFSFHA